MKNIKIFLSVLTLVLFFSGSLFAQKSEEKVEHKLVIQMTNSDTLSQYGLMKNLANLTSGWPELKIEVVCHGPGLKLLHIKHSQYIKQVEEFIAKGVDFVACQNTMKSKNVPDKMILAAARRVEMGIKEIVLKQEEGWSYIKAGIVRG